MFRPRVIPVLLLRNKGLVKTVRFKNPTYIGDPINAVRIFNEMEADELIFLDITATKENRCVNIDLVKNIGDEAYMPFAVGGGISTLEEAKKIINVGAEKIVINSIACKNPNFILELANKLGSQSIVISIDIKKSTLGKYKIWFNSGTQSSSYELKEYLKIIENAGAGEIMINSIDQDGMMKGYDLELVKMVTETVTIPVIACGGAGNLQHMKDAVIEGKASAIAAGSMFVFHGQRRAVLINYPEKKELDTIKII